MYICKSQLYQVCFSHGVVYSWDHDEDALLKARERQAATHAKQFRPSRSLSVGVALSILQ